MSSATSRANRIRNALTHEFSDPSSGSLIEIIDESHLHSRGGHETHLKILVVSAGFEGLSRIQRQKKVQELLKAEFRSGLHALSLRCLTPAEWNSFADESFRSPACSSRSTHEK